MILSRLEKRTVKALRENLHSRSVYVFCKGDETAKRFLEDAEKEGFKIGARKPTECETSDLFAIENKSQLCYCGFCSRMGFSGLPVHGGLYSVDYGKYIAGENDFLYRKDPADIVFVKLDHFGTIRITGYQKDEAVRYIRTKHYPVMSKNDEMKLINDTEDLFKVMIVPKKLDWREL